MVLEELKVEGFRSLKSVTWKPGRLNVLIGPNGGGKSNLLRALGLLRIAATGGLPEGIVEMGGMQQITWDGAAKEIRFQITAGTLLYGFGLRRKGSLGVPEVGDEVLSSLAADGSRADLPNNRERLIDRRHLAVVRPEGPTVPSELILSGARIGPGLPALLDIHSWTLQQFLRALSIHGDLRVDQDAELRRATVTRSEKRINPDGQNLIAVLHSLYTNDRDFEDFLDKAMSAAFPDDYDKLSFPPAEHGRTEMRIRRKHRKGTDSPADLSDGTLRFLLLVTILGSTDPAPLIAIDEPETGLHPRMMSIIAEAAAEAATKSQIIFTTHSPEFLDAFRDEPPTVTVVTSDGAETKLKTVGGDELKKWVADYSLGKFAFSGEAEAVL